MKFDVYTATGEKKGSATGSASLFDAKVNPDLMHRAVLLRLANRRNPIAHTKTRGEIIATTKKAFKQKGTGNARRGALSTNLLRGGGVTHGPRNTRNFTKMMPKKERRAALFSSLSAKAKAGDMFAFAGFEAKAPSTKDFMAVLAKMPEAKKYLFVLPAKNEIFQKSSRNIPGVKTILAQYVNPFDILHADKVCFVGDSLSVIEKHFVS